MNIQDVQILMQYISNLEEASQDLEKAYLRKDLQKVEEIKKFILGIKSKMDKVLK